MQVRRIALIACSGTKLDRAAPARDLYVGDLFQMSWTYTERHRPPYDAVRILSARHGLVAPLDMIAPYDEQLPRDTRKSVPWAKLVVNQMTAHWGANAELILTFLAGAAYREPLVAEIERREELAWTWTSPLAGMGIGSQKHWLKSNTPSGA